MNAKTSGVRSEILQCHLFSHMSKLRSTITLNLEGTVFNRWSKLAPPSVWVLTWTSGWMLGQCTEIGKFETRVSWEWEIGNWEFSLQQRSPTFLAPGTGFVEDSFSKDGGGGGGMVQAVIRVMGSGGWSFARWRAAHLLLCGPVPNRPGVGDPWFRPHWLLDLYVIRISQSYLIGIWIYEHRVAGKGKSWRHTG